MKNFPDLKFLLTFILTLCFELSVAFAQKGGKITGLVTDKLSREALAGASVLLEGTGKGALTDASGKFLIKEVEPGSYTVKIQFIGYQTRLIYNVAVTGSNICELNIDLEPQYKGLNEVVVKNRRFERSSETPLSIQNLSAEEIKSNPGGNFDISRVIQVLPGVAGNTGGASFRNDIIIRGGGPNENVFYLDGIEIPVINHFSTQGSSGGPQGMLNVSFIQDVTLSSGSFNSKIDNALSSVFNFRQKEGNRERLQGNFRLSASEAALTFDGPLTRNTSFLASGRRSYLRFLFMALDIPIRPDYYDFQYKTTTRISNKATFTTLGVGAIDHFRFAVPQNSTPEKEYAIRNSPNVNQWNYTIGAVYRRQIANGYLSISASRNMFNNSLDKWQDGKEKDETARSLKLRSQEIENKFRLDVNKFSGNWKYTYGFMTQYVKYNNSTFSLISNSITDSSGNLVLPAVSVNYHSVIDFFKGGIFADVSGKWLANRLTWSAGVRSDVNTFTTSGLNPFQTLSPRFSLSYSLNEKWSVSLAAGKYYKIPVYTLLGYKDPTGNYVNKDLKYISVNQFSAGVEFLPMPSLRITLEGFSKVYSNYPVSLRTGISLANQGADFNVYGNEAVTSTGKGRATGIELFIQKKLTSHLFASASYTYVISSFSGADGRLISSAWDNRNLFSGLLGYKFKRGWDLGIKYRYAGGSPYTPFNMQSSQLNYLLTGAGVQDYSRLNTLRLKPFQQVDIRIDKKINFRKMYLDVFFDMQNAFLISNESYPSYTFERTADNSGWKTTDGNSVKADGTNAIPVILKNSSATVLPTFGCIIEF